MKSSGCRSALKGEHKLGFNPPIPFIYPQKMDNNEHPLTMEIMILKDLNKSAMKDNTKKEEFPAAFETFMDNRANPMIFLKGLQMEVFEDLSISKKTTKLVNDWIAYCKLLQVVQETSWSTFYTR
jgi:hypothetical protein